MKKALVFIGLWEVFSFILILVQNAIINTGKSDLKKRVILPSFYTISASITGRILDAEYGTKNRDIFNLFGLFSKEKTEA